MTKQGIAIIDYGMGNLRSVQKAFETSGAEARIVSSPGEIKRADKIVLPGVGAFGQAMLELKKLKLVEPLIEKIKSGSPFLGLCLGLQLLFERSEEAGHERGLGLIPGRVRRFQGNMKVPHMGWNTLSFRKKNCPLFKGLQDESAFYFVHSYYAEPVDPSWTAAVTPYGKKFCSAIWKGSIFATQFHPEKSQREGLRLIKNFIRFKG